MPVVPVKNSTASSVGAPARTSAGQATAKAKAETRAGGEAGFPATQQRTSPAAGGAGPRRASQFVRERLGGNKKELPQAPLDVLYVGDGLAAKYTAAYVMDTHAKLPQEQRTNPEDEHGHLRMMMIGPNASDGVGRRLHRGPGLRG